MSEVGDGQLNYVWSPNVAVMKCNSVVTPCINCFHDMSPQHGFEAHKYRDVSIIPMEQPVFTRDCTGTVVGVSSSLNIPRNQLVLVETRHARTGTIFHWELRFKNDVSKFFTSTWEPHPDFASAHRDDDENTTTHYTYL